MTLRVLIVEDEALIAMLLEDLLAGMGHEVCAVAVTETEAVAAAMQHRPDLMIVDERLREGNGISAMAEILRNGALAHVFVSGSPGHIRAHDPGAVVLRKPFRESDLAKAIQAACDAAAPDVGSDLAGYGD
jgi:CheY-like chemotaxis protein